MNKPCWNVNAFHFFRPRSFPNGNARAKPAHFALPLCPSPFIWFCVASWLASVASASAAADTEVLRLRASRSASSIGSFSSASPRRQTAIYRFGSSALLPKGVDGPEIASIDAPENQQAEDEAVDAVDTVEKSLPAGTMILLGLASLIFPMMFTFAPDCESQIQFHSIKGMQLFHDQRSLDMVLIFRMAPRSQTAPSICHLHSLHRGHNSFTLVKRMRLMLLRMQMLMSPRPWLATLQR